MAKERSATEIKCRLHEEEMYRYYCKECKDCVCTQCLEESHDEHTFCKLQGAENVIRQDLKAFVDCPEGEVDTVTGLVTVLKDKQEAFHVDRSQLIQQIEDAADNAIKKVNESKEKLITVIDNEYARQDAFVNKQLEKLDSFKSLIKNIEQTPTDVFDVINILINIKTAFTAINAYIVETTKPQFMCNELEISIGEFTNLQIDIGVTCNESTNLEQPQQFVDTTMGNVNEEACLRDENSSDEITDVTYPVVISDIKFKSVHKIIPISKNDAWILISCDLRKIVSNVLQETIHVTDIKDFALLSNGSILTLSRKESIIQETLSNGRTAPFANAGSAYVPCTVFANKDLVFVNIGLEKQEYTCKRTHLVAEKLCKMCIFTLEGVPVTTVEISCTPSHCLPYLTLTINQTENEIIQYSLFRTVHTYPPKTEICKLSKTQSEPVTSIAKYQGAFEVTPAASTFQCHGACVDENGNVLLSDFQYKKACILDKDLKFKSALISNADVALKRPMALAVSDKILWVADEGKIFKFKYNS